LGLEFSWGDVKSGVVLAFLWPTLPGPGRQSNGSIFCLKFFLEARQSSESAEPLIDFLAYLEAKLCYKKQKVVKISTPTNTNLGRITPSLYMAVTRRQNRLESCSNPLKTREDL